MSVDWEKLQEEALRATARNEARLEARIEARKAAEEEKVAAIVDCWLAHILRTARCTGRAGQGVYHYSQDKETAALFYKARTRTEASCRALGLSVWYESSYNLQGYGETMSTTMVVASEAPPKAER